MVCRGVYRPVEVEKREGKRTPSLGNTNHAFVRIEAPARYMLSALYAIANPSVCLSVCLLFTRVDQSKTVEVRIMQFSVYSSTISLVFELQVSSRNSDGIPSQRGGVK